MPHQLTYWVVGRVNRWAVPLEWEASDTIENIKAEGVAGFGQGVCRLTFAGQQLKNGKKLSDYNIGPGDTVMCTLQPLVLRRPAAGRR